MGPGYPSETFRVPKTNEIRRFGEYRTARLVLAAWDRLETGAEAQMFTRLHLTRFKAWRDTGDADLAGHDAAGQNSSGNSSLIQSLLLLKQTAMSPDRTIYPNLGGDDLRDYFNFGDFVDVPGAGSRKRQGIYHRARFQDEIAVPCVERTFRSHLWAGFVRRHGDQGAPSCHEQPPIPCCSARAGRLFAFPRRREPAAWKRPLFGA